MPVDSSAMGLLEFAVEFVFTARRDAAEAPGVKETLFTNRQSQAIVSMGTSRILRKGDSLDVSDLVHLAVITTPPEAQKYAEMIAFNILLGDIADVFSGQPTSATGKAPDIPIPPSITAQSLLLQEVLDFLHLNKSTNFEKDIVEQQFSEQLEQQLFGADPSEMTMEERIRLAQLKIAYEVLEGRKGIHEYHITNPQDFISVAKKKIKQSIPSMDKSRLVKSSIMDMASDIQSLSREEIIQQGSHMLELAKKRPDRSEFKQMGKRELTYHYQLLRHFNGHLQRYDIPAEHYAPSYASMIKKIENRIREEAVDLDDLLTYPNLFDDQLDREKMETILNNSFDPSDPLDFLSKSNDADNLLNMNFSNMGYNRFKNEFEHMDLEDYLDYPINNSQWLDQVRNKMNQARDRKEWKEKRKIADSLMDAMSQFQSSYISNIMRSETQNLANDLIREAGSKDQLEESVDFTREHDFQKSLEDIRKKGKELGMTPLEIATLLGDLYENMKEMIKHDNPSFDMFNKLMKSATLNQQQKKELTQMSIDHQSVGSLGALAMDDLSMVSSEIPNTPEGREMLEQALGAGGGENLLYEWFKHGNHLPAWMRGIVKDAAKRVMIDLAKAKANALIGSSEAGPLPEGSTRPYMLGDDPDTIDLEETLENILFLGKQPNDVTVDDFIVRRTVTGRRCVVFLIDVSGSMNGQPLASASIATAMMLYAFSRDELGVALFESNTHVICRLSEKIDLDEVVDEILDLRARGGTQMRKALEWAEKQFVEAKSQDKMMIMVSDAMLGDFQGSMGILRKIADQEVSSVLIVPQSIYGIGNIQSIVETSNAQLVRVSDWRKFPEVVSNVLSRT